MLEQSLLFSENFSLQCTSPVDITATQSMSTAMIQYNRSELLNCRPDSGTTVKPDPAVLSRLKQLGILSGGQRGQAWGTTSTETLGSK